jgi:nitroreductase
MSEFNRGPSERDFSPLGLSVAEVLTTTRSVRKRLDFTKPVERELLEQLLSLALQAPSGSNTQRWHFLVIDDPERKRALGELYRRSYRSYRNSSAPSYGDGDVRAERFESVMSSADFLSDHLHEVPAMVIPAIEGRLPSDAPSYLQAGFWGSLLPAAWSFLLACREYGLGSSWTTLHLTYEEEAAEIVGIPFKTVTQGALFPVAYYLGESFKPAARLSVDQVVHWNSW